MSIRFQCGNCSQPIEIDDQWASKAVACPYCRKTVTAPAESTFDILEEVPLADPLTAGGTIGQRAETLHPYGVVAATSPNRIAVVAIVLAGVLVLLTVFAQVLAGSHQLELEALQKRMVELDKEGVSPFLSSQRALSELYEEYGGGPPPWMLGLFVIYMCVGIVWIATMICALVGMRRVRRRVFAVAALAMSTAFPLIACCGGMFFSRGG